MKLNNTSFIHIIIKIINNNRNKYNVSSNQMWRSKILKDSFKYLTNFLITFGF